MLCSHRFLRYEVKPHNYLLYYFFVNAPRSNAQQQQHYTDCGKNIFHFTTGRLFQILFKLQNSRFNYSHYLLKSFFLPLSPSNFINLFESSAHKLYLIFFKRHFVFLYSFKEQSLTKLSPFCQTRRRQLYFLTKRMLKDREEICSVEDRVVFLALSSSKKCRTPHSELESQ